LPEPHSVDLCLEVAAALGFHQHGSFGDFIRLVKHVPGQSPEFVELYRGSPFIEEEDFCEAMEAGGVPHAAVLIELAAHGA
jgi:hypothetical protein